MKNTALALCALPLLVVALAAQAPAPKHEDTEYYTPVPPVVTPGDAATASPPSDAIKLFDGSAASLAQWVNTNDGKPAGWTVVGDGTLLVNKSAGNIETKQKFQNYQLHIEWKEPANIAGEGQERGNSGIMLAATGPKDQGYELQIMDSYNNSTYVNGQAASMYKQSPPLVNAARKPGEWQAYDVIWMGPVFKQDGSIDTAPRVTVFHNGVLVQNNFVMKGETLHVGQPFWKAYYGGAPIKLQAHPDKSIPISFRNIWVRQLP